MPGDQLSLQDGTSIVEGTLLELPMCYRYRRSFLGRSSPGATPTSPSASNTSTSMPMSTSMPASTFGSSSSAPSLPTNGLEMSFEKEVVRTPVSPTKSMLSRFFDKQMPDKTLDDVWSSPNPRS